MTRTDWLEADGIRVREADAVRVTEYSCDFCGKPAGEPFTVQAQVLPWSGPAAQLPQYHLHRSCLAGCMPFISADLERQGI